MKPDLTRKPFVWSEWFDDGELPKEWRIARVKALHEENEDNRIADLVCRAKYRPSKNYPLGFSARLGMSLRRQIKTTGD